jgi:ACS family tartrate transporter-like MFS transporter
VKSTPQSATDIESAVIAKLTWRVVPFLFLLYIVGYLDRINVGFAALQMQQQLHFSDATYGLGMGMFFAGYCCFQVPSNLVLERVGARRWLAILMVVWGLVSASMALVHTARGFYTLRFVLGVAECGFFPGVIFYLRNWFPASSYARTVAWFSAAGPVSAVVGSPISGAILKLHSLGGLAGWQWLFILEGIPAILLGLIVPFYLVNLPHEAEWLPEEWRSWLTATLAREQKSPMAVTAAEVWKTLRAGRVWLLAMVYLTLNIAGYGIMLWLPKVIRSLAVSNTLIIGLLAAIPYVAAAVAMVLVGLHSDKSGERRWHVIGPALVGGAAAAMAAYTTSVGPMIAILSVSVLAEFSMLGPFWAFSTMAIAGTSAAAGIAVINSIGSLGGLVGPWIIGLVRNATGGFRGGLLFAGFALALSGCIALLVRLPKEPRNPEIG